MAQKDNNKKSSQHPKLTKKTEKSAPLEQKKRVTKLENEAQQVQITSEEVKKKLDEFSRDDANLENLLIASEIPILFLDVELRIRLYVGGTQALFNILPGDSGRPIEHLTHKLLYEDFTKDVKTALLGLSPIEREVRAEGGEWYLICHRPYRTGEDHIKGVVITFIDITHLKDTEQALMNAMNVAEQNVRERTEELDAASQQVIHARDLFITLFHANPIPTSITRLQDGLFLDVNEAYLNFYGLSRDQVIGHTSTELKLPLATDIHSGLNSRLRKEGTIQNLQLEITQPSGEAKTILASLQHVVVDGADALMMAFSDITERARSEKDMRTAATSMSAAEQAERQRISQVLHDDLQQNIFAVKMQLSFLNDAIKQNNLEAANVDLQQLDQWLAEAIATTRRLSVELSPPVLHGEGLTEVLLWVAAQMKTQYNLEVSVDADNTHAIIPDDARVVVVQALRELLFNVVKHAETLEAKVMVEQMAGRVNVTVSDEGKGFDTKIVKGEIPSGLKKMRDRLFLVGCNLKIESEPEKGTRVTIEAPILDSME